MTRESIAPIGDDPLVNLPLARRDTRPKPTIVVASRSYTTHGDTILMIENPIYGGAYAYGMTAIRTGLPRRNDRQELGSVA